MTSTYVAIYKRPGHTFSTARLFDPIVVLVFSANWVEMHARNEPRKKENKVKIQKVCIDIFGQEKSGPSEQNPLTREINFSAYLRVCLTLFLSSLSPPIFSVCIFFSTSLSLSRSRLSSCIFWLVAPFQLLALLDHMKGSTGAHHL